MPSQLEQGKKRRHNVDTKRRGRNGSERKVADKDVGSYISGVGSQGTAIDQQMNGKAKSFPD